MNEAVFYSKAALNGSRSTREIANTLGVSKEVMLNKLNGKTRWTAEDIAKLVYAWNLTAQDTFDIWFKESGACESQGGC